MRHLTRCFIATLLTLAVGTVTTSGSLYDGGRPCEEFKIGITAPPKNIDFKLRISIPPEDVDFKLIVIRPCENTGPVIAAQATQRVITVPRKETDEFLFKNPPFKFKTPPGKKRLGMLPGVLEQDTQQSQQPIKQR